MSISKFLAPAIVALAANAATAQTVGTKLPDYSKTLEELSAVQPTGGPGGSGNPKSGSGHDPRRRLEAGDLHPVAEGRAQRADPGAPSCR